jgi:LuxR family maltose regulon positive regulatory protein
MAIHAAKQAVTSPRRLAASAGDPVLTSKITAPDVPDWVVQRPRITELISQGTRWCPLTLVTGPVGAGKTMAVAVWTATESGPVAWVRLDEYDNRPGVFWSYVIAALRRSGVAVPKALSAALRGRAADHLFLLRLAALLASQSPPVMLVVDDFHLLTEPRVLNGLDFLLRNAGAGLRLIASSRTDPLLPLHRYRLAGQLTEIRAAGLAFSAAEAVQLLAQHRCTLSPSSLECLVRETEGWAAGLRLAAMSMTTHPDPDRFAAELVTEENVLTGYLVHEVLDSQPREAREVLLSTSILEHVNAEITSELTGNQRADRILAGLAHANAFVEPAGGGWYRYHTLFAEMLRLTLQRECPDRVGSLHREAARWYERNGQLADAVRHAAEAGDWQLASGMVVDDLAISEIIGPRGNRPLSDEFAQMPQGVAWTEPQPYLVQAAVGVSVGQLDSAAAALNAAEDLIGRLSADQEQTVRLTAAMIRLAISRRTGDFTAAAEAAAQAEVVASKVPGDKLAQRPGIRVCVLSARGAAELWSGRLDEAAGVLDAGVAAAAASGDEREGIVCLSHLALVEAVRGRLARAAKLARQATAACADGGQRPQCQHLNPVALLALAWVDMERDEQRQVRSLLKQVDAALALSPDKLIGAIASLVAGYSALAKGRGDAAVRYVARARSGWDVPPWLELELSLVESRASVAAGQIREALAVAERADDGSSPEAAVTLAHAWAAARDDDNARRTLEPVLAAHDRVPERVRLQACLVDARVSYHSGDRARGRRSLEYALRLAEREQRRLPFALERGWIAPVLQRDPELARPHQRLLTSALSHAWLPPRRDTPEETTIPAVEPLTERELQVLRHVSGLLTTAEIASELYITTSTVKSHIKNICHKLTAAHRGEAVRRARQLQLI